MRNGTKLKKILQEYTIDLSLQFGIFRLVIFKKAETIIEEPGIDHIFSGPTWSSVVNKAYSKVGKTSVKHCLDIGGTRYICGDGIDADKLKATVSLLEKVKTN